MCYEGTVFMAFLFAFVTYDVLNHLLIKVRRAINELPLTQKGQGINLWRGCPAQKEKPYHLHMPLAYRKHLPCFDFIRKWGWKEILLEV